MRVRNAKRIIMILLSIVSALLFSILISNSINVYKQSTPAKVLNASAYSFKGSGTADNPYEIGSYDDLVVFGEAVNNGDFNARDDIYIEVTNDINCGGKSITPIGYKYAHISENGNTLQGDHKCFTGVFDGQNYTISNFVLDEYGYVGNRITGHNSASGNLSYKYLRTTALFCCLKDFKLKNLKLSNISINSTTKYVDEWHFAPLIAECTGDTIVENCWVDNVGTSGSNDWFTDGFGSSGFQGYETTVKNCMLTNSSWGYGIDATNSVYIGTNSSPFTDGSSNCKNSPNDTSGLSCSSIGGSDKSEVWYYSEYYNDGYPMLRSFMSWDKVVLTNSSNDITIETTTVYVPYTMEEPKSYNIGNHLFYVPLLKIYINRGKKSFDLPEIEKSTNYTDYTGTGTKQIGTIKTGNSNLTEDTLLIFNQSVKLTASTGHYIKNLTLSATWEATTIGILSIISLTQWEIEITSGLKDYEVTFNNVSGTDSADVISPISTGGTASNDGTITFTLRYGSSIIPNISEANGPCDIVYTITNNDASETKYTVTYSIPEKYYIMSVIRCNVLTGDKEINLNAIKKSFNVKFEQADNTTLKWEDKDKGTSGSTNNWTFYSVDYGKSVTSSVNLTNNTLQFTSPKNTTLTYAPNEGFKLEKVDITVGTTKTTIEESDLSNLASILTSKLSNITNNITIKPYYIRWYNVTFKTIGNTTSPTADKTISVKSGTSISSSISTDKKTLTYTYNGESVTYKANQYYILNNTSTSLTNISSDLTIKPTAEFYACYVYTGAIGVKDEVKTVELFSGESKVKNKYVIYNTDNEIICYVNIEDDYYKTLNDGVFIVEYGTTVEFTVTPLGDGKFMYAYEFSSGQYIEYVITNDQYAMQYKLDDEGNREYIYNAINGKENSTYTIKVNGDRLYLQPTFGKKQYNVSLD